jgi:hypothetical protein
MSRSGDWSPDESLSGEAFEPGDEARAERERTDPDFVEDAEVDPSLDPTLQVDERELDEADAELDDPDGLGEPSSRTRLRREDDDGWDLDAPTGPGSEPTDD